MERLNCVVCHKQCLGIEYKPKNQNVTANVNDKGSEGSDQVNDAKHRNEVVIFLLQKVLQVPENIYGSFITSGGPESEINCCNFCYTLVEEGQNTFYQAIQLQNRFEKLQSEMKKAIAISVTSETMVSADSENGAVDAVRSYFKNGIDVSQNDQLLPGLNDHDNPSTNTNTDFERIGHKCESFKCGTCGKSLDDSHSLILNSELNDRTMKTRFKCKICEEILTMATVLQAHKKSHQIDSGSEVNVGKTKKVLKCYVCGEVHADRKSLEVHLKEHVEENEDDSKSDDKSVGNKKRVKKSKPKKAFSCSDCGKSFTSLRNLKSHMDTHEAEKPKPDFLRSPVAPERNTLNLECLEDHTYSDSDSIVQQQNSPESSQEETIEYKYVIPLDEVEEVVEAEDVKIEVENAKPDAIIYKCDTCETKILGSVQFLNHLKSHTNKSNNCEICGSSCGTRDNLKQHMKSHSEEKPFACDVCDKHFSTSFYLQSHKWTHRKKTDLDLKNSQVCVVCNAMFEKPRELLSHQRSTHKVTIEKDFKCPTCGKSLKNRATLKYHMHLHKGEKPYKCEECGKCFAWEGVLRDHKRVHSDRKYQCEWCGKYMKRRWGLILHIRGHKGEKPYTCKDCGKTFSSKGAMLKHSTSHSKEKPYKCEICGKSFKRLAYRNFHKKIHNNLPQQSTEVNCKICGKLCTTKATLYNHMSVHDDEPCQCETCGKIVVGNARLKRHMRAHLRPKPHICKICNHGFESLVLLSSHTRTHHTIEKNVFHVCGVCGKVFPRRISLQIHLRIHENKNSFNCKMCGKGFESKKTIFEHWKNQPECRYYGCGVCGLRYSLKRNLQNHINEHSKEDKEKPVITKCDICHVRCSKMYLKIHMRRHVEGKTYSCKFCGKSFVGPYVLREHMNIHTKKETYPCDICGKVYLKESTLHYHRKTHSIQNTRKRKTKHIRQKDGKCRKSKICEQSPGSLPKRKVVLKLLACKICPKKFKYPSDLTDHMNSHTGEKPYKCDDCGKSLASRSTLRKHKQTHNDRTITCEMCPKTFRYSRAFKDHMNSHTGEKPYQCDECGKFFSSKSNLCKHKQIHNDRLFMCDICGKSFNKKFYLNSHTKTHDNNREKPFQCKYCEKSFIDNKCLKRHVRIHTGETPYKCKVCDKAFTQSYTLLLHSRKHENPKEDSPRKH